MVRKAYEVWWQIDGSPETSQFFADYGEANKYLDQILEEDDKFKGTASRARLRYAVRRYDFVMDLRWGSAA